MNINLHIERLILEGLLVSPNQRSILQAYAERELTRLMIQSGVSQQLQLGGSIHSVRGGNIELDHNADTELIARQIAGAVHLRIAEPPTMESRSTSSRHSQF